MNAYSFEATTRIGMLLAVLALAGCSLSWPVAGAEGNTDSTLPTAAPSGMSSTEVRDQPTGSTEAVRVTTAPSDLLYRRRPAPEGVEQLIQYGEGGDNRCPEPPSKPIGDEAVRSKDFNIVKAGQLGWSVVFCLGAMEDPVDVTITAPGGRTIQSERLLADTWEILFHPIVGMPVGTYEITVNSRGKVLATKPFDVGYATEPLIFDMKERENLGRGSLHVGLVGFDPREVVPVGIYRRGNDGSTHEFQTFVDVPVDRHGQAVLDLSDAGPIRRCLLLAARASEAKTYKYEIQGHMVSSTDYTNPLLLSVCP